MKKFITMLAVAIVATTNAQAETETIPQPVINVTGIIAIMAFCILTTVLIGKFKYIWTVEFGNKWYSFTKKGVTA